MHVRSHCEIVRMSDGVVAPTCCMHFVLNYCSCVEVATAHQSLCTGCMFSGHSIATCAISANDVLTLDVLFDVT